MAQPAGCSRGVVPEAVGSRAFFSALLLCVVLAVGCTRERGPGGPLTRGLLDLAREAAAEGLTAAPPDERVTLEQLESLAREVRAESRRGGHPVDALNRVVFERRGFGREVDDLSLGSVLLPRVLARRRGSCMGLAALHLALGERLGQPLGAVLVPGHLFVRHADGRGVELLKGGRAMPERWYRERYRVPDKSPLYLRRVLSPRETLAVYRYNLANELRHRRRLRGALVHYRRVVAVLPDFAEAQANLGLTLQQLGQSEPARRAYLRAQAANPRLPGVERNLESLGGR